MSTASTSNIDKIFKIATDKKASDVHLIAGKPPILRVDGVLQEIEDTAILDAKKVELLVLSMLADNQKEKFLKEKELDYSYQIDGAARFRVNAHFEKGNMSLVARIIPSKVPAMEEVTMPEIVYELTRLPQGLILVTGPTGCGKSTSLAAMINLINQERKANIITLEDPIEYIHDPIKSIIRQRQYGADFLSFKQALKRILRQDPNVIMVGEMRDLETIAATITVAETGHLVLATLHTLNAAQTVDRIIDIFPPYQQPQVRLQLSMSLRGVISQQLLPSKKGGRVAAREIMINTPAVANLIRENKIAQIKTVLQTSADEGMITLDQHLKYLVKQDLVDKEVAAAHMISLDFNYEDK